MTNPDNVGGLRLSDAEIEFMANEMAGRLGEDSGHIEGMLRNLLGELCRAAPAGGGLTLENAPLGTMAPATNGGRWCRIHGGWKWNGPDGNGGVFPRPGGDWNGTLSAPAGSGEVSRLELARMELAVTAALFNYEQGDTVSEWLKNTAALLRKLQQGAESK